MIESYRFGRMCINGTWYDRDLVVAQTVLISPWWRKDGHRLLEEDLRSVLDSSAWTHVVIGTGAFGRMRLDPGFETAVREKGMILQAERTEGAVDSFNRLIKDGADVMGAFHLTC